MILLDTNLISEPWKPLPDGNVLEWFDRQSRSDLFVCAPVLAEIRAGLTMMPDGKKRAGYERSFHKLVDQDLVTDIVPFDKSCVDNYARVVSERRSQGRPAVAMDAMIAAIALTHDMTLATRNTRDFEGFGLRLVNPFEAAA